MKQNRSFLILGITGGAGSGKSTTVEYIEKMMPTVFLLCDAIAHRLMEPGGASYAALVEEFGEEILEDAPAGNSMKTVPEMEALRPISRPKLSKVAMATKETRKRLNELTHPLVQKEVELELRRLEQTGFQGVVLIEAALLIEAGYKSICDFLWYVYAPIGDRIRRMKEKRSYSDEKIANILAGQLSEAEFFSQADVVIENPDRADYKSSEGLEEQIRTRLKECMEKADKMC